jgi:hypothetical protein
MVVLSFDATDLFWYVVSFLINKAARRFGYEARLPNVDSMSGEPTRETMTKPIGSG